MPAARGVKRSASKSTTSSSSAAPKNKKKRTVVQLEVPSAPKKKGRVLACGQGDVGQLGLGEDVLETTKFKYVTALGDKIVDVYAGGMHTVALDSNGKVWTYGCNDEGALGRATAGERDEGTPKPVTLPSKAVAISAGDSHSAALLENGEVYAWGAFRDSHGSMGLVVRGREGKSCKDPVKVDIGETAAAIASGGDHLAILSTNGSVYTMGCGEQGQLGRLSQRSASRDARQGFSALLVPGKVSVKWAASRVWAGSHATFIVDANTDKVYAFGLNNYGQLGVRGEKRRGALYSPVECDAFSAAGGRWASVAVGQHHSLALDPAGAVYAVGRWDYGRLGLGDRTGDAESLEPIPALQHKKCVSIATGTSNSFAVTDTGEVWAWGMGSEGQLGTGTYTDASTPAPALLPPLDRRTPRRVSAGGQHTVLLVEDTASRKEDSPEPEKETADEKVTDTKAATDNKQERDEAVTEEGEDEAEKEKPQRKRQKKQDKDEEEVSSTSAAAPSKGADARKPEKINGDEKKETPMDVDETDKAEDKKTDNQETDKQVDAKMQEAESQQDTDASSQDSQTSQTSLEPAKDGESRAEDKASEGPCQDETKSDQDVEMEERPDPAVNGTQEDAQKPAPKTVEGLLPPVNPITTTA